jgi:hypothetical protein
MLLPVFSRRSMDGRRHGELKLTAWSLDIYYTGGLVWWGSPMVSSDKTPLTQLDNTYLTR